MDNVIVNTLLNITDCFAASPISKDSFVEVLEILKGYVKGSEFSLFCKEKSSLQMIATTINEEDEIRFLDKMMQELSNLSEVKRAGECRSNVEDTVLIPLQIGENYYGILVYEKYQKSVGLPAGEEHLLFQIMAICLFAFQLNRENRRNFYMDPLTGLPGLSYFLLCLKKFRQEQAEHWFLGIRLIDYSDQIQTIGTRGWMQLMGEITEQLQRYKRPTYRIYHDTYVLAMTGSKMDVFDMACDVKKYLSALCGYKIIILNSNITFDMLPALERDFCNCKSGSIYISDEVVQGKFDFFSEKERENKTVAELLSEQQRVDLGLYDIM